MSLCKTLNPLLSTGSTRNLEDFLSLVFNSFACWVFQCFCCHLTFFSKFTFSKKNSGTLSDLQTFWIQIRMEVLSVLTSDLGPNCFQITSFLFQAEWTAESHLSRDTIQKVLSTISYDTPPINLQGHLSVGLIPTVIREVPDALVSHSTVDKTIVF